MRNKKKEKGKGKPSKVKAKEAAAKDGEEVSGEGEIASVGGVLGALEELGATIGVYRKDFEQWGKVQRGRLWRLWIGGLLVVLVSFGSGVWVEREFEIVPLKDPTGGWRDWTWDSGYGPTVADCAIDARNRKVEGVECVLWVKPP